MVVPVDRTGGTQFFNPTAGGDVLLYQHLFWWYVSFTCKSTGTDATEMPVMPPMMKVKKKPNTHHIGVFRKTLPVAIVASQQKVWAPLGIAIIMLAAVKFGALTYWFSKVTGRMLSEKLGQLSFWMFFVGFNVTFSLCISSAYGGCHGGYTPIQQTWAGRGRLSDPGLFQLHRPAHENTDRSDVPCGYFNKFLGDTCSTKTGLLLLWFTCTDDLTANFSRRPRISAFALADGFGASVCSADDGDYIETIFST